jgi:two-component system, OmpR family, sensor kinase
MKTLHARLVLALLALLVPLSVLFVVVILTTSQGYYQEITQKLNTDLAANLVHEESSLTISEQAVAEMSETLDKVAQKVAMTNPGVEIYLVDYAGNIRGSSIAMDDIKRKKVDVQPIYTVLENGANFPVLGTDPRRERGTKIFSVARLEPAIGYLYVILADASRDSVIRTVQNGTKIFSVARLEPPIGYLYVILADASRDSVIRTVQNSTVLKVSLWVMIAALALAFVFGISMFTYLTRRLRRLSRTMTAFREGDFVLSQPLQRLKPKDELDSLHNVFADMSERISEQVQDLRQVDTLRRELITNISHDLRTPLAAIRGYLETLQLKGTTLSENERQHYLLSATKHSERLGKLISDLFDLARFDAKAVAAQPEAFLLQELAQDIVLKFEGAATN